MTTDLAAFQHPRFARFYAWLSMLNEREVAQYRARSLAGLSGRVVEIGAGNGLNFGHYPTEVSEVLAIEPDDYLRSLAEQAAAAAPVSVRVLPGHATTLPLANARCDAVVFSLVLCSVPDPGRALAEARRVLAPGGQLRFFEHVRSQRQVLAATQDLLSPVTARVAGGCHFNRDTAASIRVAGFAIDELDRIKVGPVSHVLGRARRD